MTPSSADYDYIRRLVQDHSAIMLEAGKEYLLGLRLQGLMTRHGCADIAALVQKLRTDRSGALSREVVEAMTNNETSFFRDLHPFETLRKVIVPELIRRRAAERTLDIWCGASSSGQEIYSVALTLREHFPELANWRLNIVSTDLSREMVQRGRDGRYSQIEVNRGLPAMLLVKYFERSGMDYYVKPDIRRMVDFREMNLNGPWSGVPSRLDIVFMRNVLIYFEDAVKRRILAKVHDLLRPDGYLFLGGSETTLNLEDRLEQVQLERTRCFRRRH